MTLVDRLDETARRYPHKVALRFAGRSFTYSDVKDRVDRLAAALADRGVSYQDHVAVISPNRPACIEVVLACARLGAVCEQFNIRLSAITIASLLRKSTVSMVFLTRELYELLADSLHDIGRTLTFIFVDEEEDSNSVAAYENLLRTTAPLASRPSVDPRDAAVLMYTSGTTGLPRGVVLSHEALAVRIDIDTKEMGFAHENVILCVLPLFHVTCVSSYVALCLGAEIVMADSRKAEDIVRSINDFSVTHVGIVPFMMKGIAGYIECSGGSLDTLELVIYGGEPVDASLLVRCQKLFGCKFLQGYGMTETDSAITMLLPEHHKDQRLLSTVGKAVPGMEVKVVDESGAQCGPGAIGEIVVKTPTLMVGYWHDESYTERVVRDGWYWTGDIGVLDEEGFLTLVDRKNNLVITGGENVYPLEVSRCIKSIGPDIVDVVVVGVPDDFWGESLVAFVVLKEGSSLSAQDISDCCSHCLGGYKKPRKVVFVDEFERNAAGKISKEHVSKLVAQLT